MPGKSEMLLIEGDMVSMFFNLKYDTDNIGNNFLFLVLFLVFHLVHILLVILSLQFQQLSTETLHKKYNSRKKCAELLKKWPIISLSTIRYDISKRPILTLSPPINFFESALQCIVSPAHCHAICHQR